VYTIGDPEISVPIPDYILNPACLADTLSLSLANGDPVPNVISFDTASRSVRIVETDLIHEGVYDVLVTSTFESQVNTDVTF